MWSLIAFLGSLCVRIVSWVWPTKQPTQSELDKQTQMDRQSLGDHSTDQIVKKLDDGTF